MEFRRLRAEIGKILRTLCKRKGVEILEAEACADHIHMLVSIPPKLSIDTFTSESKKRQIRKAPFRGSRRTRCGRRIFVRFSAAGKSALQAQSKPPAMPVVLILRFGKVIQKTTNGEQVTILANVRSYQRDATRSQ